MINDTQPEAKPRRPPRNKNSEAKKDDEEKEKEGKTEKKEESLRPALLDKPWRETKVDLSSDKVSNFLDFKSSDPPAGQGGAQEADIDPQHLGGGRD